MNRLKPMLLYVSLFLIGAAQGYEFGGFAKDLDVNILFPPILDRREGIPTGHLRPLGWQNRAEGPVDEETAALTPQDFWDKFVNTSRPMVIRGLVFGADAVEKWTDVHMNKLYGKLEVRVTQRIQRFVKEEVQHMSLRKFLQNYRVEDWYLRLIMPQEMQTEIPMPHIVNCGPLVQSIGSSKAAPTKDAKAQNKLSEKLKKLAKFDSATAFDLPKIAQLVEPYLWMSAGETSSLLHSHPEHNLHCVLDGRKDFIMMPIEQFKQRAEKERLEKERMTKKKTVPDPNSWRTMLDLRETYENSNEWYSKIDVDMVNAFKFSVLHDTVWYWSSLRAGDCIYIPANYLHQIRSHGRGISSSVYFVSLQQEKELTELLKQEAFSQCPKDAPLFEKMNKFQTHFLWTYTHGERHLNQRNVEANDAKRYLLYLLNNDEALHFNKFKNFFDEIMHEIKEDNHAHGDGSEPHETIDDQDADLKQLEAEDVWSDFTSVSEKADQEKPVKTLKREDIAALTENANLKRFIIVLNKSASFHDQVAKKKAASSPADVRDEL